MRETEFIVEWERRQCGASPALRETGADPLEDRAARTAGEVGCGGARDDASFPASATGARRLTIATPHAPPSSVRIVDQPLHDDVRWLAASLGRVIRRIEGETAYETIESLRQACRARRHGEPDAPGLAVLLERVDALPVELGAVTARAFTLFFLLINTAEQVHRVRRARAYRVVDDAEPQPASARWAMQRLHREGHTAAAVEQAMLQLDVRPVLTAHPTESTRRTLLALQARVADGLLLREGTPLAERRAIEEALDGEVELLWSTDEIRNDRPTVRDEVSTVLWYLETRLLDAGASARDILVRAWEDEFGATSDAVQQSVPLRLGNWVGGDRDGNPFVTPEVTLATARRASHAILGRYHEAVVALIERISISSELTDFDASLYESLERDRQLLPELWEANRRRNADEPVRLKLTFVAGRIEAARQRTAARDAGRAVNLPTAYATADELAADLLLVRDAMLAAGARHAARTSVEPLLAMVRAHGFFGFLMDVRDHADAHAAALRDVAARLGMPELDREALRRELAGRRPLVTDRVELDDATRRVLDTFAAVRTVQEELGPGAASTYIVSMTTRAEDLLRVLLLGREAGLVDLAAEPPSSRIDVVPLFETLDDLQRAPEVLRSLLDDPVYRCQLAARGNRQEVMIGYSDSGKDAGILASSWALYEGQEALARLFAEAGVQLTLFHGRGGSVGRGGGSPVSRALAALPPGTVNGRVKITEQGEIISQQFGLLPVAERTLEVTLAGALLHGFSDWQSAIGEGDMRRFRETMAQMAASGLAVYRDLVHEHDALFTLFRTATPIDELADARFGSRPAYRPGAAPGITGIRAIPWGFGWTQIRLMLTGWLGAGTALAAVLDTPDGEATLRDMARRWPFFDDLLGKIEMVCAKTDLEIARAYVTALGGDLALLDRLEQEYRTTVDALLRIRGTSELLTDIPVLRSAIALRNPYVDPLSLLQIALLRRKRALPPDDEARTRLDAVLATTLSGIAQGLRNTG
ncbi:MAG: Phosphoenolpyruvate carboxylase [Gemmatimonadetes bacterium]|nr:Phosphoenolpyruvate carboxylase [Gemmatimonadota bacterium]